MKGLLIVFAIALIFYFSELGGSKILKQRGGNKDAILGVSLVALVGGGAFAYVKYSSKTCKGFDPTRCPDNSKTIKKPEGKTCAKDKCTVDECCVCDDTYKFGEDKKSCVQIR